jgi:hypothetical protein
MLEDMVWDLPPVGNLYSRGDNAFCLVAKIVACAARST